MSGPFAGGASGSPTVLPGRSRAHAVRDAHARAAGGLPAALSSSAVGGIEPPASPKLDCHALWASSTGGSRQRIQGRRLLERLDPAVLFRDVPSGGLFLRLPSPAVSSRRG